MFNVALAYDTEFANGIAMNTVLSGYYQSDSVNSIGNDKCLTSFSASGNCLDSPNPASAFYAPESIFSRSYAEIDAFQIWNLSANFSKDDWGASVYVKNLFNEEGTTGAFTFMAGRLEPLCRARSTSATTRATIIALPLTIGAMLTYRF